MNSLVIYDSNGRIYSIIYGATETDVPVGLQSIWVVIPDGSILRNIDVSDPKNPKPVFDTYLNVNLQDIRENIEKVDNKVEQLSAYGQVGLLRKAMTFAAVSFTDEQALQVQDLYPEWSDLPDGTTLTTQEEATKGTEITRVRGDDGKLYKVIKTHQKQTDWAPGQATASLFTVIDVEHAGTLEDPIPAAVNMEYFEGKYYIEDGKLYRCTRNSETVLQYLPSQLIGQYFEIVYVREV